VPSGTPRRGSFTPRNPADQIDVSLRGLASASASEQHPFGTPDHGDTPASSSAIGKGAGAGFAGAIASATKASRIMSSPVKVSMEMKEAPNSAEAWGEDLDEYQEKVSEENHEQLERRPYMMNSWRILDLIILVAMSVDLFMEWLMPDEDVIRVGRCLRVMKIISYHHGLQYILSILGGATKPLLNVFILAASFMFIFAIVGLNMFAGMYDACNDVTVAGSVTCVGLFSASSAPFGSDVPFMAPRVWDVPTRNFDNIGQAFICLYDVCTLDTWAPVMEHAMDITGKDLQPRLNASWWSAGYFIVVILFGSLFMLQLFVSVVINMYSQLHNSVEEAEQVFEDPSAEEQFKYIRALVKAMTPRPEPRKPTGYYSRKIFNASRDGTPWHHFILTCTMINVLFIMCKTTEPSDLYLQLNTIQEYTFLTIFCAEIILKILALGSFVEYCRNSWNVFDLIVIFGSLILTIISELGIMVAITGKMARLLRIMRIVRVARYSRYIPAFCATLYASLMKVGNIFTLMVMLIYIYGILGMELFDKARFGEGLDSSSNFRTFRGATTVLFRAILGEYVMMNSNLES